MELKDTPRFGLHVIDFPSGRFGFVGTVPAELNDKVYATREAAIADANAHGWNVKAKGEPGAT